MKLDYQKELTPVLYGDSAVKLLNLSKQMPFSNCFSLHWHDRMEVLLISSGRMVVTVAGQRYEIGEGELAVFSPGVPHSGVSGDGGVTYYVIMFDIGKFYNSTGAGGKFLEPLNEQRVMFESAVKNAEVISSVKEIIKLHKNTDESSSLVEVGEVYRLIGLLFKNCLSQMQSDMHDSGRFKEVLEFVNQNFTSAITTQTLCKKFGYDETYFCRRFKTVTGLSPMVYIRILRLEKAKKLIKEGGVQINDISSACGFTEQGYFSRCFKKHYGITPSEYAKKYKR